MLSAELIQWLVPAVLSGGAVGAVMIKMLNRPVDRATAHHLSAQTRSAYQQAAAAEVQLIRDVLTEVRANDVAKTERLGRLEERIDRLEERERHMLTRAAVHEAWDQMAFQMLVAMNPAHPPPPPILVPKDVLETMGEGDAIIVDRRRNERRRGPYAGAGGVPSQGLLGHGADDDMEDDDEHDG